MTAEVKFASGDVTLDVKPFEWERQQSRNMVTFPLVLDALDKPSVRRQRLMR